MHFHQWKRREFITLASGAVIAWPLAARAQQAAMPVIGVLSIISPAPAGHLVTAFRHGLNAGGCAEGQNIAIEYRWTEGNYIRARALAADLVRRQVTLIAAFDVISVQAAKAETATIPIVFLSGADPVTVGLVASLNRPDGNLTGVSFITGAVITTRLELMRELLPKAAIIGMLVNPNFPDAETQSRDVAEAARARGLRLHVETASTERDFETAFDDLHHKQIDALLVGNDALFISWRDRLVALAALHAIPAIYTLRDFSAAGGLISYGTTLTEVYRQVGFYAGRILKGGPAELPVMQPTKFELIINLKTAKALGITVPPSLLARADEVIE